MTLGDSMQGAVVGAVVASVLFLIKEFVIDPRREFRTREDVAQDRRAQLARDELPERRRLFSNFLGALRSIWKISDFDSAAGGQDFIEARDVVDDLLVEARFCLRPETVQAMDDAFCAAVQGAGLRSDANKDRDPGLRREANRFREEYAAVRSKMLALMNEEISRLSREAGVSSGRIDGE